MYKQGLTDNFAPLDIQALTFLVVALLGFKLHPYDLYMILQLLMIYVQTS